MAQDSQTRTDMRKEIESLIRKADAANNADDALKYAQAAHNAATALQCLTIAEIKL